MANTATVEKPVSDRTARHADSVKEALATIDALKNSKGDIGLGFSRAAKYLPQFRADTDRAPNEKGQVPPAFFAPGGIVAVKGESLDRIVKAAEKATGQKIDEVTWGDKSSVKRAENGSFPSVKANVFAMTNSPIMEKAAYQTIYDGRTTEGRARQFLVANQEILHNRVRQPGENGIGIVTAEKTGLASLAMVKGSKQFETFVGAEDLKKSVEANPASAKYVRIALEEANSRYVEARTQVKANAKPKDSGVER